MCIFSCFTIRVDNCDLVFRQFPGLVDVKVGEGVEVANFGAVHNSGGAHLVSEFVRLLQSRTTPCSALGIAWHTAQPGFSLH